MSFVAAAGLGLVGVAATTRVAEGREIPLASVPLIFAAQQAVEGTLWLALGNEDLSPWVSPLANAFMVLALVAWPVWAAVAAGLVKLNRIRRLAMGVLLVLAVALAFRAAIGVWTQPYEACVVQYSISYTKGVHYSPLQFAAYVLCTCGPFLLSSYRSLRVFGTIVLAGLAISAALYTYAYVSVWCFFGAAGSLAIYLHFARAQKERASQIAS